MSNFNFDKDTVNKLKDMMNKGELNDVISQIPPEMIQNFSSMMNNSNSSNGQSTNQSSSSEDNLNQNTSSNNLNNNSSSDSSSNNSNINFNNIDMNTFLKMKSVIENLNNKNDPRCNLLYSLKPYLRESRKEKIDQYANLLNIANIAEVLKNDKNNTENKENPNG